MHNKVTSLDVSIAATLHLLNVHEHEQVIVTFMADEEWTGEFDFTVYNSPAKNSRIKPTNALVKDGVELRLTIDARAQGIAAGTYYYEIFNTQTKRVEFKGDLEIKR